MNNDELDEFKKAFNYDPETGIIINRMNRGKSRMGLEPGHYDCLGYKVIKFKGKMFKYHRVSWILYYGSWPDGFIDHANGIKDDNRIVNLRIANRAENKQNSKKAKNNTSGYKGVSFEKSTQKWRARIMEDGVNLSLGQFDSPEEAYAAYCYAADSKFGEFANMG